MLCAASINGLLMTLMDVSCMDACDCGWRSQLARKRDGWMLHEFNGWMLVLVGWRVQLARMDAARI